MNTSELSISERNVNQFKFQSQHFHKMLSVVSGGPEIKGTKALDLYSRILGFENYNDCHNYYSRQTELVKSISLPLRSKILQECSGAFDKETLEDVYLYFMFHFFAPDALPANRKVFNASLRKMDSFTQFPIREELELWRNGDQLAVDLARYFNAPELMEKQLCGIFMVYFDFYQHGLITGFDFQDVLDLLDPAKFFVSLQLYKTELSFNHGFFSTAGGVHSKMIDFCSADDMKRHQEFYFARFSEVSKKPLSMKFSHDTLFDRVYRELEKNDSKTQIS